MRTVFCACDRTRKQERTPARPCMRLHVRVPDCAAPACMRALRYAFACGVCERTLACVARAYRARAYRARARIYAGVSVGVRVGGGRGVPL